MTRKTTEERFTSYLVGAFGTAVSLITSLLTAWFVMLALGVAHGQWPAVPAFGYWATYVLVLGVSALAGAIHGGLRVKTDD